MTDVPDQMFESRVAELEERLLRLQREHADALRQISLAALPSQPASAELSEQNQVEEKIRNIALFPEENPFPVLRVQGNGMLLYANRAANQLLMQWQCPVGNEVPAFVMKEVTAALTGNANRELETGCGKREFSFVLIPITDRGYVNFYGREITKRKQTKAALAHSQKLLTRAQEIAHLGSWELNIVENSLSWSDEVFRIFGLQPQEFGASYEAFLDAVHPDDRDAVDKAYTDSLHQGQDTYEVEHRIVRKSTGEVRFVHEKCEHFRDQNGKIIRSVGMVHDVTERKKWETEIQKLNSDLKARAAELEDANKELEAFNFTVAHDLRKPLTVIRGYCGILSDLCGALDKRSLEYLQQIENGTLRMSQLIEALLEFSRLSHTEACRDSVNLSRLTRAVAADLTLTETERRVIFRIEPGMVVDADASLLRVVMSNLLGNAWKFACTHTDAIIEVGTTQVDGITTYFVRDNGPGFDLVDAEKLFTPFQRLKGANAAGFGIGLATVERIIHRHGGRVWAESEPGKGATFYFTLGD